jgi:integrase
MPARVLIVDDEPGLRDILSESLTGRGYEVETAATGAAAITAVRNQPPDVVLLDLPADLRPVAHVAYLTGWRVSELLGLTWDRVDFKAGWLRLEPGTTKNRDGRQFPFTPELRTVLEAQRDHTERIQRETGRIFPHAFHRNGKPIKDFRKAWQTACAKAGVPGRIPHDFRRTAVRNLERAGVPRSVAMKMVGHKTEAIYRRYAIVVEADLKRAAEQLHQASTQSAEARMGTIAGTIGVKHAKSTTAEAG